MEGIKVENRTHAPLDFDEHTPSTITFSRTRLYQ